MWSADWHGSLVRIVVISMGLMIILAGARP